MVEPTSRVSRVLMSGPLAPFADAYRCELRARGYTALSAVGLLRQMKRFSCWLGAGGLGVADVNGERVDQFLADQRARGCDPRSLSRPGLGYLVDVLAGLAVIEVKEPRVLSSTEVLLSAFESHLLSERGLAAGTARGYVDHAHRFLDGLGSIEVLADVAAAQVTEAVLERSAAVSVSTTQNYVASLRAFLRFCFLEGLVDSDLSEAALAITGRRRSSLPRGIAKQEAEALVSSCDRRTAIGRRDYALILTLLRLGLRRGEVAGLSLDDIDWRAG